MTVRLSKDQFEFLHHHLQEDNPALLETLMQGRNNLVFELDEDTAIEFRDWAGEKLQICGFDENYKANKIGATLEDLIDMFYC